MENQAKDKKNWFVRHKILTGILIIVVLGIIGSVASGSKSTSTTSSKPGSTASSSAPAKAKQPAWDAQAIYDQLQAGMTRAQAEQIIGKGSGTCTESATPGVGTLEICNYTGGFGSKGTISVDYLNDAIYSKTKLDF